MGFAVQLQYETMGFESTKEGFEDPDVCKFREKGALSGRNSNRLPNDFEEKSRLRVLSHEGKT
jgi:hypothetical protein